MGKSWKDKNRRDKWDNYGKGGAKKSKKFGHNQRSVKQNNKWDNYEDYSEGY
jgi:hypothetical protein